MFPFDLSWEKEMNEFSICLGQQVKKIRKSRGMTLESLANRIHKSKSTVFKYESGEISLDMETLFEISKVLSVHMYQILQPCYELIEKAHTPLKSGQASKSTFTKKHIYYYDGRVNRIRHGIITSIGDEENGCIPIFLNMNVGEGKKKTGVEYFVTGTLTTYDTFSFFRFRQVNGIGDAFLFAYKPFGSEPTATGLLTGIFKNPIAPGAVKVILSDEEIKDEESLKSAIIMTQDEIRQLKRTNIMTIDNKS